MAHKISYLANLNVELNRYDNNLKEHYKEINNLISIPNIAGLEIRFKGDFDVNSNNLFRLCDYARDNCDILNLHLSTCGLDLIKRSHSEFLDFFNVIVGHRGTHDKAFGDTAIENYARDLEKTPYRTKKTYSKNLCEILQAETLPLDVQQKFLIENGSRPYNCLPIVHRCVENDMVLDMGHFVLGTLERSYGSKPCDSLRNYVELNNEVVYKTAYLKELGSRIKHAHLHGVEEINSMLVDHTCLSSETVRGVRAEILKQIFSYSNLASATVELRPEQRTKENIIKTIENFKSIFWQENCS